MMGRLIRSFSAPRSKGKENPRHSPGPGPSQGSGQIGGEGPSSSSKPGNRNDDISLVEGEVQEEPGSPPDLSIPLIDLDDEAPFGDSVGVPASSTSKSGGDNGGGEVGRKRKHSTDDGNQTSNKDMQGREESGKRKGTGNGSIPVAVAEGENDKSDSGPVITALGKVKPEAGYVPPVKSEPEEGSLQIHDDDGEDVFIVKEILVRPPRSRTATGGGESTQNSDNRIKEENVGPEQIKKMADEHQKKLEEKEDEVEKLRKELKEMKRMLEEQTRSASLPQTSTTAVPREASPQPSCSTNVTAESNRTSADDGDENRSGTTSLLNGRNEAGVNQLVKREETGELFNGQVDADGDAIMDGRR